jgi:hypothetical protein
LNERKKAKEKMGYEKFMSNIRENVEGEGKKSEFMCLIAFDDKHKKEIIE